MSKTLKTVLISAGLLAALIFGLSKCGGSGINSGLSVLDKLVKSRPDTVVRVDTVFKLIPVYRDTCLGGIKLEDLDKKSQKKVTRILKKNKLVVPKVKLHPLDLIKVDSLGGYIWMIDTTSFSEPLDTLLESPERLYHTYRSEDSTRWYMELPVDCYTKTESAKLQKNSTKTLNAIGGIDARGYVYGGLLLRSSGGFGMGFYVSSGRYNGLQIQVPIKRFR